MQHPWTMEFNGSYHRQQLLAEAASERLAAQATRTESSRQARTATVRWMARTLLAPIVAMLVAQRIRLSN